MRLWLWTSWAWTRTGFGLPKGASATAKCLGFLCRLNVHALKKTSPSLGRGEKPPPKLCAQKEGDAYVLRPSWTGPEALGNSCDLTVLGQQGAEAHSSLPSCWVSPGSSSKAEHPKRATKVALSALKCCLWRLWKLSKLQQVGKGWALGESDYGGKKRLSHQLGARVSHSYKAQEWGEGCLGWHAQSMGRLSHLPPHRRQKV